VVRFLAAVARCLNWPPRDRAPASRSHKYFQDSRSEYRRHSTGRAMQAKRCGDHRHQGYECKIVFADFRLWSSSLISIGSIALRPFPAPPDPRNFLRKLTARGTAQGSRLSSPHALPRASFRRRVRQRLVRTAGVGLRACFRGIGYDGAPSGTGNPTTGGRGFAPPCETPARRVARQTTSASAEPPESRP
jgi:hypothetical protein